jgi:hemerythrin superfamily protein
MASSKDMDAVALLKADHRKVEDLFEKFESARSNKQKIAEQICMELMIHAQIEEEIFYPACTGKVEDAELVQEAYVEHDSAKVLIAEILAGSPDDEFYDAKVKVLSEMIKHHVKEEEKRAEGLFAEAKDAGLDMDALGEQLMARKEELMQEFKSGLPTPQTRSFKGTELEHGEPVSQAA